MAARDDLLKAAREKRAESARLRRLARGLSLNADHNSLMRQADEIDKEADALEHQAAADPASPAGRGASIKQEQVQQQQQHQSETEPNDPKKSDDKP